ncbi:MAG TPA: condensation domain-containing protein, partial [Myxococcales bacterium]|nr:condensation domain-containing protein [Myxococcales bacterium]
MSFPQAGDGRIHPLSYEQQTLLALEMARPEAFFSPTFTLQVDVALEGPLDVELLRAALADVVARHSALRTRLALDAAGDLVQEEFPRPEGAALLEEVSALSADRLSVPPFEPPLIRAALERSGPDRHQLRLAIHHAACDATGLFVALRDLALAYSARVEGGRLPPLEMGYGDYARWQAEGSAEALRAGAEFWRRYLADFPPYEVRSDLPFTPGAVSGREVRAEVLAPDELAGLARFATRARSTPLVVLLTAFHLALSDRTSSEHRLAITLFDQRDHPAARTMVGFFTRPALVRSRLDPARPLTSALEEATRSCMEAYRHAYVPASLGLAQFPPLVPSLFGEAPPWCFVVQYLPGNEPVELSFGAARGRVLKSGVNMGQEPGFSLRLRRDPAGALQGRAGYDPTQWQEPTMQRLLARLGAAARELVADSSRTPPTVHEA